MFGEVPPAHLLSKSPQLPEAKLNPTTQKKYCGENINGFKLSHFLVDCYVLKADCCRTLPFEDFAGMVHHQGQANLMYSGAGSQKKNEVRDRYRKQKLTLTSDPSNLL